MYLQGSVPISSAGCGCIAALALRNPDHSQILVDNGAADALVEALKIHNNNLKVQVISTSILLIFQIEFCCNVVFKRICFPYHRKLHVWQYAIWCPETKLFAICFYLWGQKNFLILLTRQQKTKQKLHCEIWDVM